MKPKVLILDDQTQYVRSLERVLRTEVDVLTASSQVEAKKKLSGGVELVITDIRLNEFDDDDRQGLDFIRFLRSHTKELPVIAMSALDYGNLEELALLAGANRFLRKPIVISELRNLLAALIRGET